MELILVGINVLFGICILISGLTYFKNTITTYKDDIEIKNSSKEFNFLIVVDIIFICIFIVMPTWITNSKVDFLVDVIVPSFIIVGGIEGIKYLLRNKITNLLVRINYFKYLILIILGILNGLII
ncbi:hypothetical protein COJ60_26370 [Bacillus cereus]|uniref:Membrane protein n=1 Tax=Bacillus cereus 03BB108 TaxID=451709 RepID=A0AAN0W4F8_BACCE|nr:MULTISPECIES: hypothetical protein [Bacillus cereus group]EJR48103.1 hypothetical protein IIO_06661 [Bacillus cereus VD115]MED2753973.1 hypothetical protein [Bacillus thuringiensis]AJI08307.1 putative membrane protein [Bacillus cereus 03BB108]MED2760226.1 hypothetical protein [Bacillus thuringiensis]MED2771561.1 hypothetical protein [Bacillus thuringiensis]